MNREEYLKNKLEELSPFYIKGLGNQLAYVFGIISLFEDYESTPPELEYRKNESLLWVLDEYDKLGNLNKNKETECLSNVPGSLETLEKNSACMDFGDKSKIEETKGIIKEIIDQGDEFRKTIEDYIDELKKFDPEAAEYWESKTIKNFGNHTER